MSIIRVFPRRTALTPTDEYAFIGDPPMLRPEAEEVHVSVTFTWDKARGERLQQAWGQYYQTVKLGGPAFDSPAEDFLPGMYVREGVVFTSRGCNRGCPWCLVPSREGRLILLPIQEGYIVNDNNLLQCPRWHLEAVFDMLRRQRNPAELVGGIDARLVDDWFAEQLASIRIHQVFLAADTERALRPLELALARLNFLGQNKLRCYVLIGFQGESILEAECRLKRIFNLGCLPFAMLYQPPGELIRYDSEWRHLQRMWTRPAGMKAIMRNEPTH